MGAQSTKPAVDEKQPADAQHPIYTLDDVAPHNSSSSAWIAIHGYVYDVTEFLTEHPGGTSILLNHVGDDATEAFDDTGHSSDAKALLQTMKIGKLRQDSSNDTTTAASHTTTTSSSTTTSTSSSTPSTTTSTPATKTATTSSTSTTSSTTEPISVKLLYGSQKGTAQSYAQRLASAITSMGNKYGITINTNVVSMADMDPEDLSSETYLVLCVSTYQDGTPPDNAKFFCSWLFDAAQDFRVGPKWLEMTRVAVFGLGNTLYEENFNVIAKRLSTALSSMGAIPLCTPGHADDSVSRVDVGGTAENDFMTWMHNVFMPSLTEAIVHPDKWWESYRTKSTEKKVIDDDEEYEYDDQDTDAKVEEVDEHGEKLVDLEDLGKAIKGKVKSQETKVSESKKLEPRAMLTDQLRQSLSKQGYKLIGSHSGVKLCRWTKAMLRGRGGCYKHTCYGIQSYQCMEMTPSLACANKCVFCWRHHTNPVGKEWRWLVDEPQMILDAAMENHRKMINQMKGVPGVLPERFAEASQIRHCALSLVGEPIMYPHINEYVKLLHGKGISSFLVTNAQFPDRIRDMEPVTQLYVSIDASTQESLKAVDRPLFTDFWQRFLDSLAALKDKQQRTVYRLTLVKSFNMQEIAEYAKLISIGRPTFIEIKGVTFCGNNNASNLTMKNVPFHEEVRAFAETLTKHLDGNYELACEHVHSCCILISDTSLKVNGQWHTWIDYDKFHECIMEYYKTGKTFTTMDYAAPTPAWAVYGAKEGGFNPDETRWRRKDKDGNTTQRPVPAELLASHGSESSYQ